MQAFTLKRGEVSAIDISKVGKDFTWIRCLEPDETKVALLSEVSKIPVEEFFEAVEEDERSKIVEKDVVEIVFRAPFEHNNEIITQPIYFYINKNIYTYGISCGGEGFFILFRSKIIP